MNNETKEKIEILKAKIEDRISNNNLSNGDLNGKKFQELLKKSMDNYNSVLIDRVNNNKKTLNKIIRSKRLIGKKIPYIYSMTPVVHETGKEEILIVFGDEKESYGIATIQRNMSVCFDAVFDEYFGSTKEALKVLNKNYINFVTYFNALDSFKLNYPGFYFAFGNIDSPNKTQILDDEFIMLTYDLNNLDNVGVTLSKLDDIRTASINSKNYGELYDYIIFFKERIIKNFNVNVDKLNLLYTRMYENGLKEDEYDKNNGFKKLVLK